MTQIVKGYAEALFALAFETEQTDVFQEALEDASAVLKAHPEYMELLACYGIPVNERTAALEQVFGDRLPEYVLSFLQLLCENGHIKQVFDCAREYEQLYFESRRITTVKVTSAVALSDEQKSRLELKMAALCKREIVTVYTVDSSIMGGVIVEADGKVLDGSVKHRLHEVKEVIDG